MYRDVGRFSRAALLHGRWNLSVISFYGDESGSAKHEGAYVISGYLGKDDTWSEFEMDWFEVLEHNGRRIDYFHMYDCEKQCGVFEGFNQFQAARKRDALVDVLVGYLRHSRLFEFTAILDWNAYERAVRGPLRDTYYDPYFFLFHCLIKEMADFVNQHPDWSKDGPIEFFFDDQSVRTEHDIAKQFYRAKAIAHSDFAPHLGGVSFRSDRYSYPLQAADLIAWQVHRNRLHLPIDGITDRKEFKRLRRASTGKIFLLNEEGLRLLSVMVEDGARKGIWE